MPQNDKDKDKDNKVKTSLVIVFKNTNVNIQCLPEQALALMNTWKTTSTGVVPIADALVKLDDVVCMKIGNDGKDRIN